MVRALGVQLESVTVGKAWQQELEVAGHSVATVKPQKSISTSGQLALFMHSGTLAHGIGTTHI